MKLIKKNYIKMDFQEVEFVSVDWIHLADNRDQ